MSSESEQRPLLANHPGKRPTLVTESTPAESSITDGSDFDEQELEKRFLRKLDRRMSILILIYILNYIDRSNVAAARLRGFEQDLKLEGNQFASVLSIMYVGYILMQIPSNMMLDRFGRPSLYLPTCMLLWGGISICTGFVTSFSQALCARFLLGFVEAAFFPGALFLLSKWYKRNELSTRMALLTCGIMISNAFGSLIASVILDITDDWFSYAAWRWLFFMEGGMTVVVAVISMYILPDFPENSSGWLSLHEQRLAQRRMIDDAGLGYAITSLSTKKDVFDGLALALADRKVWWLAVTMMTLVASLSFNSYFPTLTATMGYNTTITLLLCAPPWIFSSISALLVSIHSDKVQERFWHITLSLSLGCVGFLASMLTMNMPVRYISLFLMAQTFSGLVLFLAWVSGSIPYPASKRAVGIAFINSFAQLGNILGMLPRYAWPSSWGPTYFKSYALCIITSVICISMCYRFRRELASLNRMVDEGTEGMSTTSTPNDNPIGTPIQPLHNPSQAAHVVVPQAPIGNAPNPVLNMGAKALLAKKLAKSHNPNFISPTDKMMTPCTQKLTAARKKQFTKGPKPVQLFGQEDRVESNSDGELNSKIPHENGGKGPVDDSPF
ncbi:hypothetical protein AX15_004503 [Amanita polypyramis BW_CC]|nr:hypothetical protein AX15_004503 [Amanita polypyramis BW_CC]